MNRTPNGAAANPPGASHRLLTHPLRHFRRIAELESLGASRRTRLVRTNAFNLFTGIAAVVGCAALAFVIAYPTPTQPFHLSTPRKVSVSFSSGFTAHLAVTDINDLTACWTVSPNHLIPSVTWMWFDDSPSVVNIASDSEASYWSDSR